MKKSNLKNGDIVKTKNSEKFIVLFDVNTTCDRIIKSLISLKDGCYITFEELTDDLESKFNSDYDIMKVCSRTYSGDNIREHIIGDNGSWTWERPEDKKEMTIEEIEKELGYSIKIVK